MRDEYTVVTRFADLDTQRHVTSRTYEIFAVEGRYRILEALGYNRERVQQEQIYLNAVMGYAKFHRQQFPGVQLRVETLMSPIRQAGANGEGHLHWDQKIFEQNGELVCHLQLQTQTVRAGKPMTLEGINGEFTAEVLYRVLEPWSGSGQRIVNQYTTPYSERDFAGKYNVASLWKIFEEGRWMFADKVGLTYDRIVEMDTTSFYMGGIANFYQEIPAGSTMQVMTWIERFEKIRFYFRQDVMHNGKLLLSMRDEQLIVSLSKARPQRAPEAFMNYMGEYVEFPPEPAKK
jgi:acyl-CoA thioesterase FadM